MGPSREGQGSRYRTAPSAARHHNCMAIITIMLLLMLVVLLLGLPSSRAVTTTSPPAPRLLLSHQQQAERGGPNKPQAVLRQNLLKGLPALPKIHYSWPFPNQAGICQNDGPHPGPGCVRYLSDSSVDFLDGFLHDYVRITGGCPLDLAGTTAVEVHTCAAVCAASAKDPDKCIAINYSPWYAKFPSSDPTVTGAPEDAEMAFYTGLLANVSSWLAAAASPHGRTLKIGAFLLDNEKFSAAFTDKPAKIEALTRKCDLIFNASLAVAPDARIEWYGRGATEFGQ